MHGVGGRPRVRGAVVRAAPAGWHTSALVGRRWPEAGWDGGLRGPRYARLRPTHARCAGPGRGARRLWGKDVSRGAGCQGADWGVVGGAGGPVREGWGVERVLVHVLADRAALP